MEIIWLDDIPGSYHDYSCPCDEHCRNCFEDMASSRAVLARLISSGRAPASWQLGPRTKYCSTYCRGRAKRERALDRRLSGRN